MKFYETKVDIGKNGIVQLTKWIEDCVADSGVVNGVAFLNAPHTNSGVSVAPDMLLTSDLMDIQD